jgi:hypothetical protein
MNNILFNPSPNDVFKTKRECLYEWNEIKATLTEDNMILWFEDIHHVDLMNRLKIDYNNRYDIVLHMNTGKVVMTQLYNREYTEEDIEKVKNNKHVRRLMRVFEVELEYK